MLETQVIPISLDGGIDSKTNPKTVVAGKFIYVENGVYTNPGEVEKRNGYTAIPTAILGGGNLVSPQMVKVYNGELICQDSGTLYAFSQDLQVWVSKGPYTSVELSEKFIWQESNANGFTDCAALNGVALYTWSSLDPSIPVSSNLVTYVSVIDTATGTTLLAPTSMGVTAPASGMTSTFSRCLVLGNSKLAVTYINASYHLVMRILSVSPSGVSLSSEIDLSSADQRPSSAPSGISTGYIPYDGIGTSAGATLGFATLSSGVSTGFKLITVDTTGAITHTVSWTDSIFAGPIYLSQDPNGSVWIYWADYSVSWSLNYAQYSATLALQVASTVITSGQNHITAITSLSTGTNQQRVFFTVLNSNSSSTYFTGGIQQTLFSNIVAGGSVSTAALFLMGVSAYSRPFTVSGATYAVFYYLQTGPNITGTLNLPDQPTYFVVNLVTGTVIARFFAGDAVPGQFAPAVTLLSSTQALFACAAYFQSLNPDPQYYNYRPGNPPPTGIAGAASITLDFNSQNAYYSLNAGEMLVLNGALVSAYDGQTCSELGFHLSPLVSLSFSSTSGSIAPGTYSYKAVFQWTDAQGNFHQSVTSTTVSITMTSAYPSVLVAVSCPYLTQKTNVNVAIFRTKAGGTTYYQVTDPIKLLIVNNSTCYVTFTDSFADGSITGFQRLYTNGNVLDNDPPPPAMILASRGSRLWLVDSEKKNTAWYSKGFIPGNGLSMSGFLTLQIDPKLGNISGLSEMDDKMIVLKDRGIFFFAGEGANDTGGGISLTPPQLLPTDQGCNSLKSILLTPNGVFYKGPKGIYILDRALQSHYVGAEVEKWNAQTITAATLISDKSQLRFLTASGNTLVYDYLLGKWSYFTNHQGYSADNYQGLYTYVTTGGLIYQENTSSYLDSSTPYALRARLGWLGLSGLQGFQRVRRAALLGDYQNGLNAGHGVQISAAYDYQESFQPPVPFTPGAANSAGPLQYRERLTIQKCESLSLLIEEITTGASGETLSLTNLSLEAGMKRGLWKAPASKTVG